MVTAIVLGYVAVFGLAVLVLYRLGRTLRRPSEEARAAEAAARVGLVPAGPDHDDEWQYDGPDSLRLLEDLDEHFDLFVASDPELAARMEQLWNAVRDEQNKGEQP